MSLDVSPDDRLIAAGLDSGVILIWDRATGARFGSALSADVTPVWDVAFSPDGLSLASAADRSAVLWDLSGRHALGSPIGATGDVATDVAFRPDGARLAIGHYDGSIGIVDVASRKEIARIAGRSIVYAVRYSPDGSLIAAGSSDGKVRFWDAETRAPRGAPLDVGAAFVWQIAFSPDGRTLAVAVDPNGPRNIYVPDRQGEAQLWDVATRRRVGKAMIPGKHSILSLAFSPDGSILATGSLEERLRLWTVADQEPFGSPVDVKDDGVAAIAFSRDGARVAAAGAGAVRIYDAKTQRLAVPPLLGHSDAVLGAAFASNGRFLATTSSGSTRLWDPATGLAYGDSLDASPEPGSLRTEVDVPLFLPVRNAFSPDGRYLVTGGVETRAMIWDLEPATWRPRACALAGRNLTKEEWALYLPAGTPYRATCPV
ncbi:MAG: WD40 repeat domain-containing protein [Actinobacteria bacterium]|nr:WD40 repeat domain-containing protein [Actinomycetota bacterium]